MGGDISEARSLLASTLSSIADGKAPPPLPDGAPAYLLDVARTSTPEEAVGVLSSRLDELQEGVGSFSALSGNVLLDVGGSSLGLYRVSGRERDEARSLDVYEVSAIAESGERPACSGLTERHPDGTTVLIKDDAIVDRGLSAYRAGDRVPSDHLPASFTGRLDRALAGLDRTGATREDYKAATRYHELGHADLVASLDARQANEFLQSYEDIGLSEAYAALKGLELAARDGAPRTVRAMLVRDLLTWPGTAGEGFTCPYAKAAFLVLSRLDERYGLDSLPGRLDDVSRGAGALAEEVRAIAANRIRGTLAWEGLERAYEEAEASLTGQNRYVLEGSLSGREPRAMLAYLAENSTVRTPNAVYVPVTPETLGDALETFKHNVTFNVFYLEGGEVRKATAVDRATLDAYFMRDAEGGLYYLPMG